VKIVNPQLDTQIQNAITDAITKIKNIRNNTGKSFYEVVNDKVQSGEQQNVTDLVNQAVDACTTLGTLFGLAIDEIK
jgi:hypothetical protein